MPRTESKHAIEIKETLMATKRPGINELIDYLKGSDFFCAPASVRFHGCYDGGLADHSWDVYARTLKANRQFKLGVEEDSIVIATLSHDLCKIGAYIPKEEGKVNYYWNKQQPKGHALLSLKRVMEFISLVEVEEKMIKYHMGPYQLVEFDQKKGEYTLRGGVLANAWYHHPICKIMYFCDEFSCFQARADEGI